MTDLLQAARWDPRVSPRRFVRPATAGPALLLAAALVACGASDGSTPPESTASAGPLAATPGGTVSGSVDPSIDPGTAAGLDRIGGLKLESTAYPIADALAAEGGEELGVMLDQLGLEPEEVELTIFVDAGSSVGISHWALPGADAEEILAAWAAADPSGDWRSASLDGVPSLEGHGPDGSTAWATARDGVFLYVTTADRSLAESAAAAIAAP